MKLLLFGHWAKWHFEHALGLYKIGLISDEELLGTIDQVRSWVGFGRLPDETRAGFIEELRARMRYGK